MKRIDAVLFDLDGTLNDSEWLGQEAYSLGISETIGKSLTDNQKLQLIGKPFSALYQVFPDLDEADYAKIVDATLFHYKKRNREIRSYPGIKELLVSLNSSGFRLGILTAKLRENVLIELECNSILQYFENIFAKEDCREFKPSPKPLLDLAAKFGVDPMKCIYLGDQPSDILAANSAGMISCGALWGEGQENRLKPSSPMFLFETIGSFHAKVLEISGDEEQNR